jgi:uncharacterized protein (DUF1778 family)
MTALRAPNSTPAKGERRDSTINVRLTAKTRDLIDTAANLSGKTRSEFILDSARQHAVDVLLDQRLFSLDEQEYAAFLHALDYAPEPPEKLRALLRDKSPWEA